MESEGARLESLCSCSRLTPVCPLGQRCRAVVWGVLRVIPHRQRMAHVVASLEGSVVGTGTGFRLTTGMLMRPGLG